jgi:hypothetical protein
LTNPSGIATYAAGIALLGDDDVVDTLTELGDAEGLRDAAYLLSSLPADPARVKRARVLIDRAIEQIEQPGTARHRDGDGNGRDAQGRDGDGVRRHVVRGDDNRSP